MSAPAAAVEQRRALERGRGLLAWLARLAWRHPWLGSVLVGAAGYALDPRDFGLTPVDYGIFVHAGSSLVHGDLAGVFADPKVQSGPLTLLAFAAVDGVGRVLGLSAVLPFLLMSVTTVVCMTVAIRVCTRRAPEVLGGTGLLAAWLLGLAWGVFPGWWAHPTHAVVPLLWTLAVWSAQRGAAVGAGALLGLAVGVDSWAVMGVVALVLLLPDVRAAARAAGVAAGVTLLVWEPFLLTGSVRSGQLTWPAQPGTLPALLGWGDIDARYRLAQLVVIVVTGATVAWWLRRDRDLAWLLPVVLIGARLVLEGIVFEYYAVPIVTGVLTGLAVAIARLDRRVLLLGPAAVLTSTTLPVTTTFLMYLPLYGGVVLAVAAVRLPRARLALRRAA